MHFRDLEPKVVELLDKTGEFDEIISNLTNRCFDVLENISREQIGDDIDLSKISWNDEESVAYNAIIITFEKLTSKLSKKHFDPLLERLEKYATAHVLEPALAGPMFSSMVKALANAQPEETLDFFLPHLCSKVENILQEKSLYLKVTNHQSYILLSHLLSKQLISKKYK